MGEMRVAIVQWPVWLSVRNLTVGATPPPPPISAKYSKQVG